MYEYLILNDGEDIEPTIEDVLEQIEEKGWELFKGNARCYDCESAAEQILMEKYDDWEMYDEDEAVYIAIKEVRVNKELEVYRVSISYVLSTSGEMIYDDLDFKSKRN